MASKKPATTAQASRCTKWKLLQGSCSRKYKDFSRVRKGRESFRSGKSGGRLNRNSEQPRRAHCARLVLAYFFFRGPLGLEVGFCSGPFRKWVLSNRSKKTNNPNPSPIGNRFGLYGFGAGMGVRTPTRCRTRT